MSVPVEQEAGASDRAFALLQDVLPQQVLSKWMHRVARSTVPALRTGFIRAFLRAYPTIDLAEAAQPDPYAYPSFNAFFTRSLRPGVRPLAGGDDVLVSPVDGTLSQLGTLRDGELLQAKGIRYSAGALLADESAAARYEGGPYACIYLAPYDYHRIHMPLAGQLRATRYVPGALYSVNASTSRAVPNLYTRNERVVCEFDTDAGPLALVLVGALFVGSIETVHAGEINPPPVRGGAMRSIDTGLGTRFARGDELGRFNMGSTVIVLAGRGDLRLVDGLGPCSRLRLGQALARRG
ncbi:MAG: phosphatidylserine decarboxylase [Lysobacterales bacterium]|nr:MAG: phosphatidylserine decarboxylase [Xanthomonadales bacterium]